jgi:hypothetical protein
MSLKRNTSSSAGLGFGLPVETSELDGVVEVLAVQFLFKPGQVIWLTVASRPLTIGVKATALRGALSCSQSNLDGMMMCPVSCVE